MAVNAASSTYVNNASSSKGFSGLASGIDTESMVEQLLSGTQSKIDKQQGIKQQIQWKQEIYRDIISQINAFQSKFFSFSSSSNVASSSFWNSLSVFANSSALRATATSSAATGSSTISVRRLASKTSVTSGKAVSGELTGKLDTSALKGLTDEQLKGNYSVRFKVGDTVVNADLKDVFVSEDGKTFTNMTTAELDNAVRERLEAAFKDAKVEVKVRVTDGAVSISSSGNNRQTISVSEESGAMGLQKLGLAAGAASADNASDKITTLSGKVEAAPRIEFTIALDDLKKTISIDLRKTMKNDGSIDKNALKQQLQEGLNKAHGVGQIQVKDTTDGFTLAVSAGRKVDIGGSEEALSVLGMEDGDSNRISLSTKLSDLNLGTSLWGDSYRFTINDVEFHFTGDTAIIDLMDVINRSDAGVRMIYRAQDDKFMLECKESGAGKQISMDQSEGNLINALFGGGVAAAGERKSGSLWSYRVKESDMIPPSEDGEEVDLGTMTLAELGITGLTDRSGNPLDPDITLLSQLEKLSGGKYYYKVGNFGEDGRKVTIMQNPDGDTTLGDLGITINGFEDVDASTKLSYLKSLTGGRLAYNRSDGTITWNNFFTDDKDTKESLERLFGSEITDPVNGPARDDGTDRQFVTVMGQNADVVIDGVATERSSNNFTVNGVNYDISDITGTYEDPGLYAVEQEDGGYKYYIAFHEVEDGEGNISIEYWDEDEVDPADDPSLVLVGGEWKKFIGTPATVTVSRDTDSIINSLKEFIDEYNVLVKGLNDLLDEDTNYRDYPPLTAAQKQEMSDREIELWEKKAKEGLLHRDPTIQDFLQQMRTALYQKPAGASYALYELGIETGDWEMKGQLSFTLGGEATIRNLLENDPAGVASLFTTVGGLGSTLNDILKQTASTSSGSPGTLVQIAGIKGTDKSSSMYEQMKKIDEKIEALKRTYEMEKTRYWKQFNTMEQLISNMNTQSAYLAQMMGMSY